MDRTVALALAELNTRFYAEQAASFSATRQSPWSGWGRVGELLAGGGGAAGGGAAAGGDGAAAGGGGGAAGGNEVRLLDLACGNMRFEAFLRESFPATRWRFCAADNCALLAAPSAAQDDAAFLAIDAIAELAAGSLGTRLGTAGPFDGAVCFGFLHHVPGVEWRVALLRALVESVRPGGLVAISFWRFMSHPKLAEKALVTTAQAVEELSWLEADDLEAGDYVLGWQDCPGVFRYCHHFDGAEIDALVAAVPEAELVERFRADGRSGDLNEYVILRRALQ